jgi:hypothetical protein
LAKEDAAAAISSAIAFRNNFAGRVDVKLFRSNTARVRRGDGWIFLRSARILADVTPKSET